MPISGLSIVLSPDAQCAEQACEAIGREPRIEVGERQGARLAIVSETQSTDEDKQLWNWLWDLPGVAHVDVAFIHFEPPNDSGVVDPQLQSQAPNDTRQPAEGR